MLPEKVDGLKVRPYSELMSDTTDPRRRPISDSPWFWVYLFCTGGLIALVLMGNKFGARQAEIERQYQGRQRAMQNQVGQAPSTKMSTRDKTIITLRPLYLILGGALLVAWSLLWWTHFRRRRPVHQGPRRETAT